MQQRATWLVCGGLGFIGSHFVRIALAERPELRIVNLDAVKYAGNPANLADVVHDARYTFVGGNVCDARMVAHLLQTHQPDTIVNFAAETPADRTILDAEAFILTDVIGAHALLDCARQAGVQRFVQISTDEVYGDVERGRVTESAALAPRTLHAASRAGADLQVLAYAAMFGLHVSIVRGSNTYGPYQYPEKMIPQFTTNLLDDLPVPLHGDGLQVRDWLHVEDHARGILAVLDAGAAGEIYNLGADNARTNLDVTRALLALTGRDPATHIQFVSEHPEHDRRYALDSSKIHALGWKPLRTFEDGLALTVAWYRNNEAWWRSIKSAAAEPVPAP